MNDKIMELSGDSASMHFELAVYFPRLDEYSSKEKKTCSIHDLFYLFTFPCGLFVDSYELSTWRNLLAFNSTIYLERDEVLCERVCSHDRLERIKGVITLGIEFFEIKSQGCELTNSNPSFSIPLHKQYFTFNQTSSLYNKIRLHSPSIYFRDSLANGTIMGAHGSKKLYQKSFLGNAGNINFHPSEIPKEFNYTLIVNKNIQELTVTTPIGDQTQLMIVGYMNVILYTLITVILFSKIMCK